MKNIWFNQIKKRWKNPQRSYLWNFNAISRNRSCISHHKSNLCFLPRLFHCRCPFPIFYKTSSSRTRSSTYWFLKQNQEKATAKNLTKNANPFSSVFVPLEISLTKQVFCSTFIWQLSSARRRELANLLESQTYLWFLL